MESAADCPYQWLMGGSKREKRRSYETFLNLALFLGSMNWEKWGSLAFCFVCFVFGLGWAFLYIYIWREKNLILSLLYAIPMRRQSNFTTNYNCIIFENNEVGRRKSRKKNMEYWNV